MKDTNQISFRRDFLKSGAAAALGLGCLSLRSSAQHLLAPRHSEDEPNTHNMMIVGTRTAYLSHLPMFVGEGSGPEFDSPHRFQVILEATFTSGTRNLTQTYANDRLSHPGVKMYTLNPRDFVLSHVDPNGKALKKFQGNAIFRGHLERGGRRFIGATSAFDVNVKRVVHFRQFDPGENRPAQLEYLLFGKGGEIFLAHLITKPNDFDQIISVRITGHPFTDDQLGKGMHVKFSARGNAAAERLKEKEKANGEFQVPDGTPRTLPVEVVREFYFEEGELAMPPSFEATPEEKKAGFN